MRAGVLILSLRRLWHWGLEDTLAPWVSKWISGNLKEQNISLLRSPYPGKQTQPNASATHCSGPRPISLGFQQLLLKILSMTLNVSPTGGSLNAFRKGRSVQPTGFSIVYQTGGLSDTSRTQIADRPSFPSSGAPCLSALCLPVNIHTLSSCPCGITPPGAGIGVVFRCCCCTRCSERTRGLSRRCGQMLFRGAKAWNCAITGYVRMFLPKCSPQRSQPFTSSTVRMRIVVLFKFVAV